MKYTCSECLRRGEIIEKRATKITFMLMFLGKIVTLKDLKVQVNRKQISPEKCLKIQTKDNQDML